MGRGWFAGAVVAVAMVVAPACGDRDSGERTSLAALLERDRVVVVGELHGTNEFPAAIGRAAEEASRSGTSLTVALEWPRDDQTLVDDFLGSEGSESDRAALLSSRFWTFTDGRTSTAMLDLLDRLRVLRHDGRDLRVTLFDVGRDLQFSPQELARQRDRLMAEHFVYLASSDDRPMLVLVGNHHARKSGNDPPSMVQRLLEDGVDVVALNAVHGGGDAWTCLPDGCGEHSFPGRALAEEPFVATGGDGTADGYDGVLYVVTITASPPANAQ